jgi:hypothetical protein
VVASAMVWRWLARFSGSAEHETVVARATWRRKTQHCGVLDAGAASATGQQQVLCASGSESGTAAWATRRRRVWRGAATCASRASAAWIASTVRRRNRARAIRWRCCRRVRCGNGKRCYRDKGRGCTTLCALRWVVPRRDRERAPLGQNGVVVRGKGRSQAGALLIRVWQAVR